MAYQSPVDVLRSARARLATPGGWLHASPHQATNAHGEGCRAYDDGAVAWDVYAALLAAKSGDAALDTALGFVAVAAGLRTEVVKPLDLEVFDEVLRWQDDPHRALSAVLSALDRAIDLAVAAAAGAT